MAKDTDSTLIHEQIAMMEDTAGQSLQTRFENFCKEAVEALTVTNEHGEPIFDAGKAKSKMKINISVIRTANDAMTFEFDHKIETSHPRCPGRARSSPLVRNIGLVRRVTSKNMPLFDPAGGQPTAMEIAEAERKMAATDEGATPDANGEVK